MCRFYVSRVCRGRGRRIQGAQGEQEAPERLGQAETGDRRPGSCEINHNTALLHTFLTKIFLLTDMGILEESAEIWDFIVKFKCGGGFYLQVIIRN